MRLLMSVIALVYASTGMLWAQPEPTPYGVEAVPAIRVTIIGDITVRDYPAFTAVTVTEQAAKYLPEGGYSAGQEGVHQAYDRMLFRGYDKLARWMKNGGNPIGPTFIIYYDDQHTVPPEQFTIKIGYPAPARAKGLDSVKVEVIPAMTAVVAQFSGPFKDSEVVWDSLAAWIAEHGYVPAGPPMEVYLRGMLDNTSPAENFGEVRWPVRTVDSPAVPTEPAVPVGGRK